jgi:hypothetical protein
MSHRTPETAVRRSSILFLALAASSPAWAGDCPVPGPRDNWLADYCLFKVESDDIVAASPCMLSEGKRRWRNDCEAKQYYKRQICRRLAAWRVQTEEECFKDPSVMGPTMRQLVEE